jgi:hypothetical protein
VIPDDLKTALEHLGRADLHGVSLEDDLILDAVYLLMRKYGIILPQDYEPMDHTGK